MSDIYTELADDIQSTVSGGTLDAAGVRRAIVNWHRAHREGAIDARDELFVRIDQILDTFDSHNLDTEEALEAIREQLLPWKRMRAQEREEGER